MKKAGQAFNIEGLLLDDKKKLRLFELLYFSLYPTSSLEFVAQGYAADFQELFENRDAILNSMHVALLPLFFDIPRRHIKKCKSCYSVIEEALEDLQSHIEFIQKYIEEYKLRNPVEEEEHTNEA